MSNDQRRALLATFLVILTGFAALTGLMLLISSPISAQGTFQNQRDPTACDAIGNRGTNCEDALSSDNAYASNSGWFHPDWQFRKKITINSTKITADSNDFPVLINITDADLRDDAQNDGDDILFTDADGLTKLSHEIERFKGTTGELVAWVNVTSLSSTVDTEIYMHYGHGTIGNQEGTTGVWDGGYAGVYHLREIPDGTVDDIKDSTQHANHGISSGMTETDQVAGQIDGSLNFEITDGVTVRGSEQTFLNQAVDPFPYAGQDPFEQYLFEAPNRLETVIGSGVAQATYEMFFHSGARDVDFGIFYDSNCDGAYTLADDVIGSVASTVENPERARILSPASGCYWVHAAGFDVDPGSLYDLTLMLVSDSASLEFEQAGSVAAWFNSDVALNFVPGGDTPRYRVLVSRENSFVLEYDSASGRFQIRVYQTGGFTIYHTRLDGSGPQSVPAGEWHHLAFTFNKTHGWAYYDGASRGDADSAFVGQDFSNGVAMIVGAADWDGKLDEVRVSDIPSEAARAAGWIATGYNNQNDTSTFYGVGVEERPTSDTAWKNFGFNLNATDTIDQVEIGVEWFRDNAAPILNATISWDGGTTWAANRTATNKSTDDNALQFLDFTSAVSWTPSMLSDARLRARAGTNASGAHLDHIAVRVTFTTASPPGGPDSAPVVVTLAATNVTQDTAILRGSLGDLGSATDVQVSFEWGLSPALGTGTAAETLQTLATFQASLDGLNPGTTYYYRAKATGNGTAVGETLTFQTGPPAVAGDLFSPLGLWLVLAAIAVVVAYLLTRRQLAAPRRPGGPREAARKPYRARKARGGLFAKIGGVVAGGRGASQVPATDLGGVAGAPMPSEILCPHCGTRPEGGAVYCYGCGRAIAEGADLEASVERGRGARSEKEVDGDAPFTESPQLTGVGGTCPYCGTTVEPETGNCPECARSVPDRGEALEEEVKGALAALDLDENDKDALFALGTYLLLDGKAQEALDTLNRLTLLDFDYPGLWRAKALAFEKLGKKRAAEWARARA